MAAPGALGIAWYLLLGVLLCGYSILDGFDLGIGILYKTLGRDFRERRLLARAIAPVWDGNEVWLVTAGGALFAAFPRAYATVFSGFYPAVMLMLSGLILRAAAIEFRAHDGRRRGLWEGVFVGASFVPALLLGVALGNVVGGVPLDDRLEYAGGFPGLLRPLPLAFGALSVLAFMMHGAAYAAKRTEDPLRARANRLAGRLVAPYGIAFVAVEVLLAARVDGFARRPAAWAGAAAFVASLAVLAVMLRTGKDRAAFLASSAAIASVWAMVGAVQYPYLVRGEDPARSLTIANAASGPATLRAMLIIAAVGLPLVLASTAALYRAFRGRVGVAENGGPGDHGRY